MARIRTIKPSFFTSLTIGDIDDPWTRLLFIGLWTHVDDEGRCIEDRRLIRAAIFPMDDHSLDDIGRMIMALADRDLVHRYVHDDRRYLAIGSWNEHQKIDRSKLSDLPDPDGLGSLVVPADAPFDDGATRHRRANGDASLLEGKGREGKGREHLRSIDESTTTRPPRLPAIADGPSAKERRDAMWDALADHLGPAATATERSNRGRTVNELIAADATPQDVPVRCDEYRRRFPDAELTDAALRKHWSALGTLTAKAGPIYTRSNQAVANAIAKHIGGTA